MHAAIGQSPGVSQSQVGSKENGMLDVLQDVRDLGWRRSVRIASVGEQLAGCWVAQGKRLGHLVQNRGVLLVPDGLEALHGGRVGFADALEPGG